jgi:hypothetical protein
LGIVLTYLLLETLLRAHGWDRWRPVLVNETEEEGDTPAKQMVRMAWRPPIPLLIALTLGLNVGLQDCEVNLLQGDIAFLEILQELSTDSAIPVCGLGTIPLLVQVNLELFEPNLMGQGLWGHDGTSCKKSSEVLTPPHKLWEGKRARHQEGHRFHLPPSHNVVVKINLLISSC